MPEVVHLRGGHAVMLGPCPSWCTENRHFAEDEPVDTDDGYHHYGPEIEVPTSDRFLGITDEQETVVRVVLKSWTYPLDAEVGPALIELNLGTVEERTDACVELTPDEARAVAQALLDQVAIVEQSGEAAKPSV